MDLNNNPHQSLSSWRRQSQHTEPDVDNLQRPLKSEMSMKSSQTVNRFTQFLPKASKESIRSDGNQQDTVELQDHTIQDVEPVKNPPKSFKPILKHFKGGSLDQILPSSRFQPDDKLNQQGQRLIANNIILQGNISAVRRRQMNKVTKSTIVQPLRCQSSVANTQKQNLTPQKASIHYNQIFLTAPQQPIVIRQIPGIQQMMQQVKPRPKKPQSSINAGYSYHISTLQSPQSQSDKTSSPSSPHCKKIIFDGRGMKFHRMKHQQYQDFIRTIMDVKRDFDDLVKKQGELRKKNKERSPGPHNVQKELFSFY